MHILVLQHAVVEHPGIFRSFLARDDHTYDAVELDQGAALPALDGYDALWVMGGPMDVWQEAEHPWLRAEKALIKDAVQTRNMPFLGLCLGHQLLAEALGGHVGKSNVPEVGVMDVSLTAAGTAATIFAKLPQRFGCLQWHSAEVITMPVGAICLAASAACAVQAMQWGAQAFSAQFHIEIEPDTVLNWAEIPEYAVALGAGGVERMGADAAVHMAVFNQMAEQLYTNWMAING
ncbi:MAG: type 1 glutamine amidotransferase [Planktomarina sp.]|nr:type 1 glutamine amidotransferase [Planktomarina sp.]